MPMKTLDQITIECGADKGSTHPVKGHDYARHYDSAFEAIRQGEIKVVEVGVGSGESIRSWLEYFPNAKVFGVDIVHSTNEWNTVGAKPHPRYTFVTGDQSSEIFWQCFVVDYGSQWDVFVDDGGHSSQQIITTFNMMWPHVAAGGFYGIEDLNCAYSSLPFFCSPGWQNHMDFIKDMLDQINRKQNGIDSLRYANELVILQKSR